MFSYFSGLAVDRRRVRVWGCAGFLSVADTEPDHVPGCEVGQMRIEHAHFDRLAAGGDQLEVPAVETEVLDTAVSADGVASDVKAVFGQDAWLGVA
jgi:hypothetical protein